MPPGKADKQVSLGAGKFIIPSDPRGFQNPDYWNQFFASRNTAFEWYGNFLELSGVLCKYIKPKDTILVIGSGNSELSAEMYYTGLKNITNIDISQVVVDRMTKKYLEGCQDMKFVQDDVMNMMTVQDESFSVVLDKATFDALVADDSAQSTEIARKICGEIDRVLKFGGRYICITLAQKHVLAILTATMAEKSYAIRAHVINVDHADSDRPDDVVFAFVFTKMKPGFPLVCELQLHPEEKLTRAEDFHDFLYKIRDYQYAQSMARSLRMGRYSTVEGQHLKIYRSDRSEHAYNLYPYKPDIKKPQFTAACFIIPPGRSKTYLYGTHDGRKDIADQNISAQLVMFVEVIRAPNGLFSFDAVKNELTPHLKNLTPSKLFEKMVFLTDGAFPESEIAVKGDDVVYEGNSTTTGEYRILQRRLVDRPDFERRLVFVESPHAIQTEMRVSKGIGNHADTVEFDRDYLPSDYQRCIVAAVLNHKNLCVKETGSLRILLIGLGGGVLTSFIHNNFPTCSIEAVEIDPAMVEIAIRFFGLRVDERCAVHVADGSLFLKEAEERKESYDMIIVDADTKDSVLPLRCPPTEFVSQPMLKLMRRLLNENGMLAFNILTRKGFIAERIKDGILNVFGNVVYTRGQDDELNSVAISLHGNYFNPNAGDKLESEIKQRSKDALNPWRDNLRRFNQQMDEKCGEILIDGNAWWARTEVQLTKSFIYGTEDPEEKYEDFLSKQKYD